MDIVGQLNDDGAPISAYLLDREEANGFAQLRKSYRWSYLHTQRTPAPWVLTTSYLLTGSAAFTAGVPFQMGALGLDVRQNFPVATVGKRIQRQYANANVGENMALTGETFYFDVRPLQP
jgi:hypothetical protein